MTETVLLSLDVAGLLTALVVLIGCEGRQP